MKKTYIRPLLTMLNCTAEGELMGLPAVVSDPTFDGARQRSSYDEESDEESPSRITRRRVWDEEE